MNLCTTLRLRFVPFNSIIRFERLRGTISATKERIQVSILMELRNPWTFGSIASTKRILWKTESWIVIPSIYPLLWNNFSPFSPPLLSTMFRCFAFLVRAVYARKEFLFRFGLPYERTSTMESGGLTPRWLTIARQSRDFTLHPIRESGRNGSDSIREEFGDHRRAYLSDKGQARILKDASTVTTSSMIPNVMYITPRCTRENR